MYIHTCVHTYVYVYVHIYIYVYMYICKYSYISMYIYISIYSVDIRNQSQYIQHAEIAMTHSFASLSAHAYTHNF